MILKLVLMDCGSCRLVAFASVVYFLALPSSQMDSQLQRLNAPSTKPTPSPLRFLNLLIASRLILSHYYGHYAAAFTTLTDWNSDANLTRNLGSENTASMSTLVARHPLQMLSMSAAQRGPRRLSARLQEKDDGQPTTSGLHANGRHATNGFGAEAGSSRDAGPAAKKRKMGI